MSKLVESKNFHDRVMTGVILGAVIVLSLMTEEARAFRALFIFMGIMAMIEFIPIISRKIFYGAIIDDRSFIFELLVIFFGVFSVVFLLEKLEIILVLLASVINDTGAYFIGNLLHGKIFKSKPFPRTSPKKSWEGIIGGCSFTVISLLILRHFGIEISLTFIIFSPVVAIFGDYLESFVKRALEIKDSSEPILSQHTPILTTFELAMSGHGGYADRIDSWTAVACLMALIKIVKN